MNFCTSTIWQRHCCILSRCEDPPDLVNVGTGTDVTIRELAEIVAATVGYEGQILLDSYEARWHTGQADRYWLDSVDWAGSRESDLADGIRLDLRRLFGRNPTA